MPLLTDLKASRTAHVPYQSFMFVAERVAAEWLPGKRLGGLPGNQRSWPGA
jgi:hypothetical protein